VCQKQKAKYRCPNCSIASCSLACVREHKSATYCDGTVQPRAVETTSELSHEVLKEDFQFLRGVGEGVAQAGRDAGNMESSRRFSRNQKRMQDACKKRSCTLEFMPEQMSRRKENTTFFRFKEDKIYWRVAWVFNGTVALSIQEDNVCEDVDILQHVDEIMRLHCTGSRRALLSEMMEGDHLSSQFTVALFMERSQNRFKRIEKGMTLRGAMQNATVIEYPFIHILTNSRFDASLVSTAQGRLDKKGKKTSVIQRPAGHTKGEEERKEGNNVQDVLNDISTALQRDATRVHTLADEEVEGEPNKRQKRSHSDIEEKKDVHTEITSEGGAREEESGSTETTMAALVNYGSSSDDE